MDGADTHIALKCSKLLNADVFKQKQPALRVFLHVHTVLLSKLKYTATVILGKL